jgi:mono/diheme cytochrome c family protein
MKSFIFKGFIAAIAIVSLYSFKNFPQPTEKWNIPTEYSQMKNPIVKNAQNLKEGKELFEANCLACHGQKGNGEGAKAIRLKMKAGDLRSSELKEQPDGNYFHRIKFGRNGLHSFNGKLKDDEIWTVIHYLKTL